MVGGKGNRREVRCNMRLEEMIGRVMEGKMSVGHERREKEGQERKGRREENKIEDLHNCLSVHIMWLDLRRHC